ncbi:hypothetical protein JL721_132 [Aureococcus anophagefferens]|nr:hypothetical protein JL721_132 [Aureococcus anophagefferens]
MGRSEKSEKRRAKRQRRKKGKKGKDGDESDPPATPDGAAAAPEPEPAAPPLALPAAGATPAKPAASATPRPLSAWCAKFLKTDRSEIRSEPPAPRTPPTTRTRRFAAAPEAPARPADAASDGGGSDSSDGDDASDAPPSDAPDEAPAAFRGATGPNAGRPAGYGVLSYASAEDAARGGPGRAFEGRDLRAREEIVSSAGDDDELRSPDRKRRKVGARAAPARYFDDGAGEPARGRDFFGAGPRCSLCASDAHLMDACPEALCHRCLRRATRRDCRDAPRPMPEVCTACGDVGHSWKWCEAVDGEAKLSAGATCMTCGERGHLDCKKKRGHARRR